MEEKHLLETAEIDENDWEQTPVSVRNLVVKLFDKIEQLEKHLKELQETNEKISEKVNQNSQNSNNPPTSDRQMGASHFCNEYKYLYKKTSCSKAFNIA